MIIASNNLSVNMNYFYKNDFFEELEDRLPDTYDLYEVLND